MKWDSDEVLVVFSSSLLGASEVVLQGWCWWVTAFSHGAIYKKEIIGMASTRLTRLLTDAGH